MDDRMSPVARARLVERAVGIVISEMLAAVQNSATDEIAIARIRDMMLAEEDALRASLSLMGIDSLTWMAVLTALEETFDVLFADDVASDPGSYTILGLACALVDCLGGKRARGAA
jgi:acyl carrier protein